ncbi:FAD-binding oxidoreductase [Ammoniphilus sp. CFH 90114]|uniref:NAD(P)/FAD-dependent oxidoreductase n=1 Tax=Ammoniphilus sp. CFH 90114 TaxID=2493665 RepID=UPI00100F327A|nr:FAD-binding oxidoreductase [Ammoniphilus sp. CFH 90114]RXT08011.1 FAD-binding oxidoreductase [Ammoniphilus sp. CFH 90114]
MKKILIIGAGILGASTAYQLAKRGADVTIIDRKDRGQATDAAAGIICPWISQRRNKAWYKLVKEGARFYPRLIEELRKDGESQTGYAGVGALSLHRDSEKLIKLQERALKRKEEAPEMGEITLMDAKQTKALFPPLTEDFSSVHVEGAARVDGRALRDALLRAAQKNGAQLLYGDASLLHQDSRVTGAEVAGESHFADTVIACTGAWAGQLLEPLGVHFKITYQKAQIVHLDLHQANTEQWPVIMPPTDQYLLAFEDQRIVVGATHENDIEGFDTKATAGGIHEVLTKALDTAPGLAQGTFLEVRVGFRPYTPGFLPVIGALPGFEGILLANGLGASGLTMGPYLGSQLAKLALDLPTDIDISLYDITGAISD